MTQASELIEHARQVKQRLRFPPNAVPDSGVDLKRRPVIEAPPPEPAAKLPFLEAPPLPPSLTALVKIDIEKRAHAIAKLIEANCERPKRVPKIREIIEAAAFVGGITAHDIISQRRHLHVVLFRHLAMYVAKDVTVHSLAEIGRRFGGRDHTTVLHVMTKIDRLVARDETAAAQIEQIKSLLPSPP